MKRSIFGGLCMPRLLYTLLMLLPMAWNASACDNEDPRRVAEAVLAPMVVPAPCPDPDDGGATTPLYAVFQGQSVPDQMVAGQNYNVSLSFRNTGAMAWETHRAFNLGSQPAGNTRWGPTRVGLPHNAGYGQDVTFNFSVRAPDQAGTHDFQWKMVLDGVQWLGQPSTLKRINVVRSTIKGNIDGVSGTHITGWACSTYIETPIDVHVYVGGAAGSGTHAITGRADQAGEAGLGTQCGTQNTARRFRIAVPPNVVNGYSNSLVYVHGISAVGGSNDLLTGSGVHRIPYNKFPTVSLTSPANGGVVGEGNPIVLVASASDPDDGVASVAFLGDGRQLAVTSPPNLTYSWSTTPGDHTVRARAVDTRGAEGFSDTRTVHVSRVTGAVTGMRDGKILGWACNTKVKGAIRVHLYVGGQSGVGTYAGEFNATNASAADVNASCGAGTAHNFNITPPASVVTEHAGKTIHVHGISSFGGPNHLLGGSGSLILKANAAPKATITSPASGAILAHPGAVRFTAAASDADGVVTQVQLLLNGVAVATPTTAPYEVQLEDLPVGTHKLRAVAKDSRGATGSHEITIKVQQGQAPASITRQYVYDAQQQLCKVIEPETGSTVMDYDPAGNLAWSAGGLNLPSATSCDRESARTSGRRVDRLYDVRNRLLELTFPDGNGNQRWEYTPDGLPSKVTTWNDGGASTVVNTYAYNKRRLMTAETVSVNDAAPVTIGYTYDANGNLSGQTRPGGLALQYQPNALGQPTQVRDAAGQIYAQGIAWHANGALARLTYGNGVQHQTVLNARQLPAQLRDSGALALNYEYDVNGNVTAILDQQQGTSKDVRMRYDAHNRLAEATSAAYGGNGQFRYRYDVLDNLTSTALGGVKAHNYWYDAKNRLTNVRDDSGATTMGLAYDVQGNLANRSGQVHAFDFGNRLREVAGIERYRYDAHGRRVSATDGNGQRLFSLYGNDGTLLYEQRRGRGNTDYIQLGTRLLATRTSGVVTWQHTDALGSPVASTNGSGAVVERKQFEPYGASVGTATDGVGYTGHVMDAGTGLTYMQQRYYDPGLGIFLSVDPVTAYGDPVSAFGRYRYANSNPYRFIDPDGRQSWSNTGTANAWPAVQRACGGNNSCEQDVAWDLAKAEAKISLTAYGGTTVSGLLRAIAAPLRAAAGEAQNPTVAGVKIGDRPSETRAALEGAGYKGVRISNNSGTESGTLHNVPGMRMDVRVMDGGQRHAPRVVTTRQGNPRQPVNPQNGKNFGNIPKGEQRTGSHIYYREKK